MSGTTRIPAAEITGFKGWLIKRFARRTLGTVPTSIGVYWHHQQVLMDMASVGRKVQKWDRCDEQLKSFAHMVVASRVGCTWCLDFNYFEAHNKDLDMEKAREVPRWRESKVFSPLERAVLAYAEAMTETQPTVADDLVESLLSQLGEAGVLELTAVVAFANFTTRANVALGIESDGFADACGLTPLAQPTTPPVTVGWWGLFRGPVLRRAPGLLFAVAYRCSARPARRRTSSGRRAIRWDAIGADAREPCATPACSWSGGAPARPSTGSAASAAVASSTLGESLHGPLPTPRTWPHVELAESVSFAMLPPCWRRCDTVERAVFVLRQVCRPAVRRDREAVDQSVPAVRQIVTRPQHVALPAATGGGPPQRARQVVERFLRRRHPRDLKASSTPWPRRLLVADDRHRPGDAQPLLRRAKKSPTSSVPSRSRTPAPRLPRPALTAPPRQDRRVATATHRPWQPLVETASSPRSTQSATRPSSAASTPRRRSAGDPRAAEGR